MAGRGIQAVKKRKIGSCEGKMFPAVMFRRSFSDFV